MQKLWIWQQNIIGCQDLHSMQFLFQFGGKCLPGEDLAGINFQKVREE